MIRRLLILALALAAPLLFSSPVQASADSTCYPQWKVKQLDYFGCSGMALLSPGNDTRINLLMLLNDRNGAVGVSHANSYDMMERRGDAQPFDYGIFSLAIGQKPPEDENADVDGFGTRCVTNAGGQAAFDAALAAAKGLSANERDTLSKARRAMQPECSDGSDMRAMVAEAAASVSSVTAKAFADYLRGTAAFYDGDFATARGFYLGLAKAGAAWPKEAAAYMLGRVELNVAMAAAFDEYGYLADDKTGDTRALAAAEKAFKAYIAAYPQGAYTVSAQGLLRKVYWLGKDNDRLLAEYVAAFKRKNLDGSNVSLADLVQEMDVKLGGWIEPDKVSDPFVLAMADLQAMRYSDDPDYPSDVKPITRAALDAQKAKFAGQEALFDYVRAVHSLYVAKDPDGALKLLPANAPGDGYLAFSQRALRALALDAKGDPGARAALAAVLDSGSKAFQRGTMELALAMHDERHAALDKVFDPASPVKDAEAREILLRYTAGPKLLRTQAAKAAAKQEREVALYTLLYKEITRGFYRDFLADQALIPAGTRPKPQDDYTAPVYTNIAIFKWAGAKDGFACPSLATLATALAGAPKDAPSLLCLGEFARLNGFDEGSSWPDLPASLDKPPPKDELGGTPSLFPGKPFSRLEIYKSVIADPAAAPTSKAYALYRAVYCYGPSGYNSCGGTEVPIATRKGWFNQLKKTYPTSPWATKLKYYW